ncbi:hypothetical protein HD806DRAFT_550920 [Xylariaceae sp. AK1471]|nr:hypothetical protein HD806DRAFT_550920 [Xylariaceae sp. AK1471]
MTALQIAALYGDMGAALVLLEHGATINAPPAKRGMRYCALDAAALEGRLDMVKFLLNMAAHSHDHGTIRLAVENHHFAVAELIREQIRLFGNCIIVNLEADNLVDVSDDSSQSSGDYDDCDDDSDYSD